MQGSIFGSLQTLFGQSSLPAHPRASTPSDGQDGMAEHEQRFLLSWLPDTVQQDAAQEQSRFSGLSQAILSVVHLGQAQWERLRDYIPILNNFLDTHQYFATSDVVPLAQGLYEVVCSASHDLEVQVRTADCLSKLLHSHKRVLSKTLHAEQPQTPATSGATEPDGAPVFEPALLTLPWKPLFNTLVRLYVDSPPAMEGMGLTTTRHSALTTLVTRCRRYFEPQAVVELWELLRPAVVTVAHTPLEAYMALGWLALFAPTNNINRAGVGVASQLLQEWMSCWAMLACSGAWDAMWAGLLARFAKHDWKGHLDWQPYLPVLFSRMIDMFELPVGSATNASMVARPTPPRITLLFGSLVKGLPQSMARMVVHLLRVSPKQPHTAARAADVMRRLKQLAALLDNYLHPSNTGRWCKGLSSYLGRLVAEYIMQTGKQGPTPAAWSSYLPAESRDAFAELATALAARAQFSKDDGLSSEAVSCLGQLAYLAPDKVLPLVVTRFRTALENATATHQLCAAISTLARCVRPLLLSGWGLEEETGPQLLAEALIALLPGLDANDEAKTLAVIHFYTSVLSTAPFLGSEAELEEEYVQGAVVVPVFVEEWADDVVTRLTSLLSNLDTGPGHRSTDAAAGRGPGGAGGGHTGSDSFLMGSQSLFGPLIELLVSRLPRSVAGSVARRVASFAASETLPGVEASVSTMLAEVAQHHPQIIVDDFVRPTLTRVTRDLSLGGSEGSLHEISGALEATVCHKMHLLHAVLWHLPHTQVLALETDILRLVDLTMLVMSRQVQDSGGNLLSAVLHSMTEPQLSVPAPHLAPLGANGALVLEWVDRTGAGADPLNWIPAPVDGAARAQPLVDRYLLQPAARLAASAGGATGTGSGYSGASTNTAKLARHSELVKMKAVLLGLLDHLEDFQLPATASTATQQQDAPVYVSGNVAPVVGQGQRIRETLAAQLAVIGPTLYGQHDSQSLVEYLVVCEFILCPGALEFSESRAMEARSRARQLLLQEPAAAGVLATQNTQAGAQGDSQQGRPWRKRIPQLAAAVQTTNMLLWRNSQRVFRHWATAAWPTLTEGAQLSPEYRGLLECVCTLAVHPLRQVRSEAVAVLGPIVTRFPVLAQHTMPFFLSSLAEVPTLHELTPAAAASGPVLHSAAAVYQQRLLSAALRDVTAPQGVQVVAVPAAATVEAEETQGAKDARVEGAVQALCNCLPFWRLVSRQSLWYHSLMYAVMASRVHNSTGAQASLGTLFIHMVSRHLKPPSLDPAAPEAAQCASVLLHLADMDTLRSSWRYCLTANVLCLVLLPPPATGQACMPFIRHLLAVLKPGSMPQLGRLAISALALQLSRIVDYREDNPEMVSAVSSWLSEPDSGAALVSLLSSDHSTLEAAEAGQDSRGGGGLAALQSKLLNMSHEDFVLRVVAASIDFRGARWPEGGTSQWQPVGVAQGFFVVPHAQLVRLLATVAPAAAAAALQPQLAKAQLAASEQRVVTTSDKCEQAAAAEVMAGLLAAGVQQVDSAGTGWLLEACMKQLQACTLELSESWSLAVRFAVYGIMGILHPTFSLSHHLGLATQPRHLLTPELAQTALQGIFDLASNCGPRPGHLTHTSQATLAGTAGTTDAPVNGSGNGTATLSVGQVAVLKRLKCVYQCVRELLTCSPSANTPLPVLSFWLYVSLELRHVLDMDVLSQRQQLGKMIGAMIMHLGAAARSPSSTGASSLDMEVVHAPVVEALDDASPSPIPADQPCDIHTVRQAVAQLEQALLRAWSGGCGVVQVLRQSGGSAPATGGEAGVRGGDGNGNGGGSSGSEDRPGSDIVMVDRPRSPVPLGDDESLRSTPMTSAPATPLVPEDTHVALSKVGLGLSLLTWSAVHSNLTAMQTLLFNMLPQLFRLQELAGPVLQKLSHEAMLALALAKYWPPPSNPAALQQVLDGLTEAMSVAPTTMTTPTTSTVTTSAADSWSTRAAALSYAQIWWFRTCFLLPLSQTSQLVQLVQDRLADSKPEVRVMAGATLSGMLRGMDPTEATSLRTRFISRASQILTTRKRPATDSAEAPAGPTLLEKHAVVQGLTAFLQSTPYDCPPWLPSVLLALVRPATAQHGFGLEAAIRTAASKALSEFKRTHEQDSLQELRTMMSEDEWDSLQQATSHASYFT